MGRLVIFFQILAYPCPCGCTKPHAEEGKGGGSSHFHLGRSLRSTTPPPSSSVYPAPCKPRLSALIGHAPRGHPKHDVYGRPGKVREEGKRGELTPAVNCPSSANRTFMEAFLNVQLDQFDAGVKKKPPQFLAEYAEPEKVTTRLRQKLARDAYKER